MDSNLIIVLRSPSGHEVTLSRFFGGTGTTTPTPSSTTRPRRHLGRHAPFTGSFRPYEPLSALVGEDANGTWELRVVDFYVVDSGSVTAWSIDVL